MEHDAVIKFSSGEDVEVRMAEDCDLRDSALTVTFKENDMQRTIYMFEIICIFMNDIPPGLSSYKDEESTIEEVEIISGQHYFIRVFHQHEFPAGFFAHSLDTDMDHRYIFFTIHGCRTRRKAKPIGEILKDRGHLSAKDLEEALKAQQDLRNRRIGEILADRHGLSQQSVEDVIKRAKQPISEHQNKRVGNILIEEGLITYKQLEEALILQEKGRQKRIGDIFVERGMVSELQLYEALASKFHMRFVDLDQTKVDREVLKLLPIIIIEQYGVIPLMKNEDTIVVAMSDPTKTWVGDIIRIYTNTRVELVIATASQIISIIHNHIKSQKRLQILPLAIHDDCLVVATSRPGDPCIRDIIRFYTGGRVELAAAPSDLISAAIHRYYSING